MKIYDFRPSKKIIAAQTKEELLAKYNGEWKQCPTVTPFKYRKRKTGLDNIAKA